MTHQFDPEQVALAARRLAAKMAADQHVPLMMSYVGVTGDPTLDSAAIVDGDVPVVVIARGRGAAKLLEWIDQVARRGHSEMVPVDKVHRPFRFNGKLLEELTRDERRDCRETVRASLTAGLSDPEQKLAAALRRLDELDKEQP